MYDQVASTQRFLECWSCGGTDIRVWCVCVQFLLSSIELFDLFYVFRVIVVYVQCGFIVPPTTIICLLNFLWNLCGIYLSTCLLWNSLQLFTCFTNMENQAESTAAQCVFEVIHSFHRNYYYDYSLILILFLSSCELFGVVEQLYGLMLKWLNFAKQYAFGRRKIDCKWFMRYVLR